MTDETRAIRDVIPPFDSHDHESDPAEEAARNLDWQAFFAAHPPRHRTAILVSGDRLPAEDPAHASKPTQNRIR